MSKPTNHIDRTKAPICGFHLYADNNLLAKVSDRFVWQTLYNIANPQCDVSKAPAAVKISLKKLAYLANVEKEHTAPSSLKRLEKLGLIKKTNTSIIVEFSKYLKVVRFFESLAHSSQAKFAKDFKNIGVLAFDKWSYHKTHKRNANTNNIIHAKNTSGNEK